MVIMDATEIIQLFFSFLHQQVPTSTIINLDPETRTLHLNEENNKCYECNETQTMSSKQSAVDNLHSQTGYRDPELSRSEFFNEVLIPFFLIAIILLILTILYSFLLLCLVRVGSGIDPVNDRMHFEICGFRCNVPLLCFKVIIEQINLDDEYDDNHAGEHRQNVQGNERATKVERRRALDEILKGDSFILENFEEYTHRKKCDVEVGGLPKDNEENSICGVCLGNYDTNDRVFSSPNTCSHIYHYNCIVNWLEIKGNTCCPYCRKDFISEEDIFLKVSELRIEDMNNENKETERNFEENSINQLGTRGQILETNNNPSTEQITVSSANIHEGTTIR